MCPRAQHKAKQGGDQHADGQDIQRRVGLRGDHPVIHLHGKDNPRQGQDVNEQRGEHHPAVGAQVAHHQSVKPVRTVFRNIGIHAAVFQRGQWAQGNDVADGGQHGGHRKPVGVGLIVEKADLQRIVAIEMFDHADPAVVHCRHDRQTPAVDRLLIRRQQLKRQPCFTGQLSQCRHHRFSF